MTTISVNQVIDNGTFRFEVQVQDEQGQTEHRVAMSKAFYESLETQLSPAEVIKKSFEFLLEREAKEMILAEFDVTVISNYFPDFKKKLVERLDG